MRAPRLALTAAALLAAEALALAVIVAGELAALIGGGATSVPTALALIVLTVLGAVLLAVFAIGVAHGRSLARSGAIVLHVLALILAGAALTIDPPAPLFAGTVGLPAVIGVVLLVASARQEGMSGYLDEPEAASDPDDATPGKG